MPQTPVVKKEGEQRPNESWEGPDCEPTPPKESTQHARIMFQRAPRLPNAKDRLSPPPNRLQPRFTFLHQDKQARTPTTPVDRSPLNPVPALPRSTKPCACCCLDTPNPVPASPHSSDPVAAAPCCIRSPAHVIQCLSHAEALRHPWVAVDILECHLLLAADVEHLWTGSTGQHDTARHSTAQHSMAMVELLFYKLTNC
jgi:hypothetical protein